MSELVTVEDAVSATKLRKDPLYANRVRVYPKNVGGTFRRLKWIVLVVLLGVYYGAAWIRWDRGPNAPDQAFLIDIVGRRAYFLWIEIWPQELYFLMGLLILAAIGLFLVTSLAGRVWCGYTCPQTVWTDLFMWVERIIEGDRAARMRLDNGPLTVTKVARKIAKHGVWVVIAALTGGAWIMYFNDAPTVVPAIFTGQAGWMVYFFVALLTATTYTLAGWAREQVCTYMCPWPRFQSALFDEDTLIVTYEKWRGEPRGPHKKGTTWDDRGHCVDCNQCVAVCPVGIDIRDGQQLECISCALCIDACNGVMQKVGLPGNLITYDTERRQVDRAQGTKTRYRLLRPRTAIYSVLFFAAAALIAFGLLTRSSLDLNILHDRSPLFVKLSDGSIRNGYTVKILNKAREARELSLSIDGIAPDQVQIVGVDETDIDDAVLNAAPDTVTTYKVYLALPDGSFNPSGTPFSIAVSDSGGGETTVSETVFRGPER